jgi:hypothetical protein
MRKMTGFGMNLRSIVRKMTGFGMNLRSSVLEDYNLAAIGLPRRHGGCGVTSYIRIAEHAAYKSCVTELLSSGILSPTHWRQLVTTRTSQSQTVYLHQSRWVPRLSDGSWICELRHRALLPDRQVCPRCNQDPTTLGHAALCMSSVLQSRHDSIADSFKVILSSMFAVNTEGPVCHDNNNLRADLKVTQRAIEGVQARAVTYYDLTIVESQCATALERYASSTTDRPAALPPDNRAALQLESLVNYKYSRKLEKYHGMVVPLVIMSEGYMHAEFIKLLSTVPNYIRTQLRCAVAGALLVFRGFRHTALPQVPTSIN